MWSDRWCGVLEWREKEVDGWMELQYAALPTLRDRNFGKRGSQWPSRPLGVGRLVSFGHTLRSDKPAASSHGLQSVDSENCLKCDWVVRHAICSGTPYLDGEREVCTREVAVLVVNAESTKMGESVPVNFKTAYFPSWRRVCVGNFSHGKKV